MGWYKIWKSISLPFLVSRSYLYFLTHGPLSIFKANDVAPTYVNWEISFNDFNPPVSSYQVPLWILYYPLKPYRVIFQLIFLNFNHICNVPFAMTGNKVIGLRHFTGRYLWGTIILSATERIYEIPGCILNKCQSYTTNKQKNLMNYSN